MSQPPNAMRLETIGLTKRFGDFVALDDVSITIQPGTVHALLGENGAGKSTLVKCLSGYHAADDGALVLDQREQTLASPTDARRLGIGMVYQHFTVVPGMTVAENLLLATGDLPALIRWPRVRAELAAFMQSTPFQLDLDARPVDLSAGQKQKLEILKQMRLRPRLLILDEPTSVLTPQEADEVLGALRLRAHAGACSIILITHKFREVLAYADEVSVLRRGRHVGSAPVSTVTQASLAQQMVGEAVSATLPIERVATPAGTARLSVTKLHVNGDRGTPALQGLTLDVAAGEIVGVAGVSGNGQRELMQALTGQRRIMGGTISVGGRPFVATRTQNRELGVRSLPEEPLLNACVPDMSVADNLSLRTFDEAPCAWLGWRQPRALRTLATAAIAAFGVRTRGPEESIRQLSGGNIQRVVLARELSGRADLLLVSNPTFGLDFSATRDIHRRLLEARNEGSAVLLISEDLDELMLLADRIAVISAGQIVFTCPAAGADRQALGAAMGGSLHEQPSTDQPSETEFAA
jgi:simple sugar transport system ATP-binding protein